MFSSTRKTTILYKFFFDFRLNFVLSGSLNAFQFHVINVLLYAVLCVLVTPTLDMFVRKKKSQTAISEKAYLGAMLFTVHPVHTENVAALVGRADVLSSILVLVSLLLYRISKVRNSLSGFSVIVGVIFAAVLCKETAIMALVSIWFIQSVPNIFSSKFAVNKKHFNKLYLLLKIISSGLIYDNISPSKFIFLTGIYGVWNTV